MSNLENTNLPVYCIYCWRHTLNLLCPQYSFLLKREQNKTSLPGYCMDMYMKDHEASQLLLQWMPYK